MRLGKLRSVAHNLADSLASGCSLLVGMYELDVFGEAANSPEHIIEVDFLAGTAIGGQISPTLAQAIRRFREVLPDLCRKHGVPETAFRQLRTRYFGGGRSATFVVTVEEADGRIAMDTYVGMPGTRPRTVDHPGRIRTIRSRAQRVGR